MGNQYGVDKSIVGVVVTEACEAIRTEDPEAMGVTNVPEIVAGTTDVARST